MQLQTPLGERRGWCVRAPPHASHRICSEDIVQQHHPLAPELDSVRKAGVEIGFNGVRTIEEKTRYALERGIAGVMIWEVGQDCRLEPVTHGEDTHVRTCPADDASLLLAISRSIEAAGRVRARKPGWSPPAGARGGEL